MTDVFISYASEDRSAAAAVAAAIQSRGYAVWWDRIIPPGRQYDEVIEAQVKAAHCVVVLWSKASAASRWVKNEAAEALEHDTLVPALIEPAVAIPFEFRRVQAADLTGWREGLGGPAVDAVIAAIAALAGRTAEPAPPRPAPAPAPAPAPVQAPPPFADGPRPAAPARRRWLWWAAGLGVAAVALNAALQEPASAPAPIPAPIPGPAPMPAPAPGSLPGPGPAEFRGGNVDLPLVWHDDVLRYGGRLLWAQGAGGAWVDVRAVDSGSGQIVAQGRYAAVVQYPVPGQVVFSLQVPVAGDSRTPGPHVHGVNLVFERQPDGLWRFARNCMAPGRPDLCFS